MGKRAVVQEETSEAKRIKSAESCAQVLESTNQAGLWHELSGMWETLPCCFKVQLARLRMTPAGLRYLLNGAGDLGGVQREL